MKNCSRQRHGFTLVELLVVVAVITVLAGLLLPALSNARAKARESTCISQLSQIGKAVQMYLDDHAGRRPLRLDSLWPRYVSDKQLFVCPSDNWVHKGGWAYSAWGKQVTPPELWPIPISYGYFFHTTFSSDKKWEQAKAAPGRPGYAVCMLHGAPVTASLQYKVGEAPFFRGRILRLCFDGSVIARNYNRKNFNTWTLQTDQEKYPLNP